jgi:preprotein translocase subunit SecF
MEFGTVLIVVSVVAVVVAAVSYWGSGRLYSGIGTEGGLDMRRERETPATSAEAQEEIRQMLEAKSARREARGEAPLDVEAELAELTRPAAGADPALREEVRQLVIARNERRVRQGKEALDVEAEVERQLRSLGGDVDPLSG